MGWSINKLVSALALLLPLSLKCFHGKWDTSILKAHCFLLEIKENGKKFDFPSVWSPLTMLTHYYVPLRRKTVTLMRDTKISTLELP